MKDTKTPEIVHVNDVSIEVAATAGFCFGVERAVRLTQQLVDEGRSVATLGPLIHNPQVVNELKRQGVLTVNEPGEVPGGAVAVVRSHGVPQNVYNKLLENGTEVCDATCPYVAKIHNIAKKCGEEGGVLLIAGDEKHPEVQGIVGHASGEVIVFENSEDLKGKISALHTEKTVFMVAQTTYQITNWLECTAFIKKVCTKCRVFDTICSATWAKQQESEALAKHCDLVVVVGGRGSSNTRKLYEVAAAYTRTVWVQAAQELSADVVLGAKAIGVTAGASTPSSAIEEVVATMSDVIRTEEKSFEEMLDDSMKPVYAGMVVKGVVESVSANEITVDIGQKQTGIVKLDELTDDASVRSAEELVKRDEELELVVVKVNDQDGIIYLSRKQMQSRKGAEDVAKAAEDGTVMDGYVVEINKGGLVAIVKGIKVFVPASQATARRGDDYTQLLRKHVQLKIKEFSPRRTIGSIRDVLADENRAAREEFWNSIEAGKQYTGTVKSLTNYGAFVDIGGVDGLVHISELSWNRIKHPGEVLKVGQQVEVYVKEFNREAHKVSLGYKKQEDNPWEKLRDEHPVGSVFNAQVVSITKFGAFVRILPGIDGLVHISEISYDRVENVADVLKVGQQVEVKLMEVDFERRRISLSMKALLPEPEVPAEREDGGLVASSSEEATTVAPDMQAEIEAAAEEGPKPKTKAKAAKKEEPAAEEVKAAEEAEPVAEVAEEEKAADKTEDTKTAEE